MCNWEFPRSDNWWLEGDKAWFCAAGLCALFCVDLNSQSCELLSQIPECDTLNYAAHTYCVKYGNRVFCLPNLGEDIWCYDLLNSVWERVEMINGHQMLFCPTTYKKNEGRLWILNSGGNIFEVNFERWSAKIRYHFTPCENQINGEYVLVNNRLYCVSGKCIYCFDVRNDCAIVYDVSEIKGGLLTICYDGVDFWLSGLCGEIYIWNPEKGIVNVITNFPEQFGVYNFDGENSSLINYDVCANDIGELLLFTTSISLGNYIWYIPWQSNQIIFIDKKSYKVFSLEVEEEVETNVSLKRDITAKYAVEYVLKERYIGLYSYKNRNLFEIDTVGLCVRKKNYEPNLSEDYILSRARAMVVYNKRKVLYERSELEQWLFSMLLKEDYRDVKNNYQNIGRVIYQTLDR